MRSPSNDCKGQGEWAEVEALAGVSAAEPAAEIVLSEAEGA